MVTAFKPDTEPEWRAKLDVALDAMMTGQIEISEAIFDELDALCTAWHLAVPFRQRTGLRHPDIEARRVLATICSWNGATLTQLATWFGVSTSTASSYVRRGEWLLLRRRGFAIGHPNGVLRTSYEIRYPQIVDGRVAVYDLPTLEEDWVPADARRKARRGLIGACGDSGAELMGLVGGSSSMIGSLVVGRRKK